MNTFSNSRKPYESCEAEDEIRIDEVTVITSLIIFDQKNEFCLILKWKVKDNWRNDPRYDTRRDDSVSHRQKLA